MGMLLSAAAPSQDDLSKRYGCLANGAGDIKNHAWFRGVDWARVARREDAPPIRSLGGMFDLDGMRHYMTAGHADALQVCHACRPVVKAADDRSNFDDYGNLGPMRHEFELSMNEQAMFAGF